MRDTICIWVAILFGALSSWLSWYVSPQFVSTFFLIPVGFILTWAALQAWPFACIRIFDREGLEIMPTLIGSYVLFGVSWLVVAGIWIYNHTTVVVAP